MFLVLLTMSLGIEPTARQVTDEKQVNAALDVTRNLSGENISVAVNCAGVAYAKRTLNPKGEPHSLEDFTRVLTVNAIGCFNVLRLSSTRMAKMPKDENGLRGVIINTASIAGAAAPFILPFEKFVLFIWCFIFLTYMWSSLTSHSI